MDVTFVCSGEEPFKMEVGFFDNVLDIKEKLQSLKGWPAAALTLVHNGVRLADDGGSTESYGIVEGSVIHVFLDVQKKRRCRRRDVDVLRVKVMSRCGRRCVEVAVDARSTVSELRKEMESVHGEAGFPLPCEGAYFFIHNQCVMDEERSFEWHGVGPGDEIVVFDGWVTRGPA